MGAEIPVVIEAVRAARSVAVLTGAGISKESGIPTFRDAQTGLWAKYDPEKLATPEGFLRDPALVWTWYDYRRKLVTEAQPNAGHKALVTLEQLKPTSIVTQNVDGLHARAGSTKIIELHGSILKFVCFDKRHAADAVTQGLSEPPRCTICGAMIRPAVVWFGEALPPQALDAATEAMQSCDVVLVIGTSGLVHPAAGLPYVAKRAGAIVIEINPEVTSLTDAADIFVAGPAGQLLPEIVAALQ